jgi:hypothetical protein
MIHLTHALGKQKFLINPTFVVMIEAYEGINQHRGAQSKVTYRRGQYAESLYVLETMEQIEDLIRGD